MTPAAEFYHALAVDDDLCLGCAHCIRRCPTKALRIRKGKASLRKNWCIDCGECLKVCPAGAIYVEQDDFDDMLRYQVRAVMFPATLLGQFPSTESRERIFEAIRALGFTHIYPAELTASVIRRQMAAAMAAKPEKPAISPFCPAVVRLIQTKFPELTEHILALRTPVEATAQLLRHRIQMQGVAAEQIGIFYVTPCAAKAAAIRQGDGQQPLIDGILNLNLFYNKICQRLRIKPTSQESVAVPPCDQMGWGMTGGEAEGFVGRTFAVDGIDHVAEFLERLQTTGELHLTDFLELRACHRSCVGGALTPANRFLAEERLRSRIAEQQSAAKTTDITDDEERYLIARIETPRVLPMTKLLYQGDIEEVLEQMNQSQQVENRLPGIDCGACGSPSCRSLANDIIRGEAVAENCIFIQLSATREAGAKQALHRMEEVWGGERFEQKTEKPK